MEPAERFIAISMHGGDWGHIAGYLTQNIPKKYRVVISRFRMGAHALEVEVGRHKNITFENRLCRYCKSIGRNCVEDEQHFLFECQLYDDIRQAHQSCFIDIPRNLFSIFSTKSGELLASLIHSCVSKRGAFLQQHLQQSSELGLAP